MKRAVVGIVVAISVAFLTGGIAQAQEKAPGTVILKGNKTMGGVKFDHAAHAKKVGDKCETCHHPSKPEKAMKAKHEACQGCHASTIAAPMKTNAKAAFHDAMAKKGTCIDCHAKEVAAGKKAPAKCIDCHKKENV
ncbi:MAG TPA: cytochrome c3 family protein [Vicinamibacterales bacterium]|jgi:flavoprotein